MMLLHLHVTHKHDDDGGGGHCGDDADDDLSYLNIYQENT